MTDQGWMVDDGTCGPCLHEHCHACTDPHLEGDADGGLWRVCCCDAAYEIGPVAHPLEGEAE